MISEHSTSPFSHLSPFAHLITTRMYYDIVQHVLSSVAVASQRGNVMVVLAG